MSEQTPVSRGEERNAFLALAVFAAPIATVVIVAGYGFLVWISQMLSGPPSY
ncbi:MAG: nitrate reductase [Pseudomonadales bacterium]|nr:nitrate reductase [Pseudomonadales bacterium]